MCDHSFIHISLAAGYMYQYISPKVARPIGRVVNPFSRELCFARLIEGPESLEAASILGLANTVLWPSQPPAVCT